MTTTFWVVMAPGADRPYVSSHRPSKERAEQLQAGGCEVFRVEVELEGWDYEDGVVRSRHVTREF